MQFCVGTAVVLCTDLCFAVLLRFSLLCGFTSTTVIPAVWLGISSTTEDENVRNGFIFLLISKRTLFSVQCGRKFNDCFFVAVHITTVLAFPSRVARARTHR